LASAAIADTPKEGCLETTPAPAAGFRLGGAERAARVRAVTKAAHGTSAGWHTGCRCTLCRQAHSDTQRAFGRARAQKRLSVELRQQLLDAIYAGQPFRTTLQDLGLTPNQVWGLTKTDEGWSTALEAALTASLVESTSSTELTPPTLPAASAKSVASTSGSGWRGIANAGRFVVRTEFPGLFTRSVNDRL
jgi:hypothetical protein